MKKENQPILGFKLPPWFYGCLLGIAIVLAVAMHYHSKNISQRLKDSQFDARITRVMTRGSGGVWIDTLDRSPSNNDEIIGFVPLDHTVGCFDTAFGREVFVRKNVASDTLYFLDSLRRVIWWSKIE